jgi:hypothetical protein
VQQRWGRPGARGGGAGAALRSGALRDDLPGGRAAAPPPRGRGLCRGRPARPARHQAQGRSCQLPANSEPEPEQ